MSGLSQLNALAHKTLASVEELHQMSTSNGSRIKGMKSPKQMKQVRRVHTSQLSPSSSSAWVKLSRVYATEMPASKAQTSSSGAEDVAVCPICLDELHEGGSEGHPVGASYIKLCTCSHAYHTQCLARLGCDARIERAQCHCISSLALDVLNEVAK